MHDAHAAALVACALEAAIPPSRAVGSGGATATAAPASPSSGGEDNSHSCGGGEEARLRDAAGRLRLAMELAVMDRRRLGSAPESSHAFYARMWHDLREAHKQQLRRVYFVCLPRPALPPPAPPAATAPVGGRAAGRGGVWAEARVWPDPDKLELPSASSQGSGTTPLPPSSHSPNQHREQVIEEDEDEEDRLAEQGLRELHSECQVWTPGPEAKWVQRLAHSGGTHAERLADAARALGLAPPAAPPGPLSSVPVEGGGVGFCGPPRGGVGPPVGCSSSDAIAQDTDITRPLRG